jgi:chromosome segregation ATPase
MSGVKSLLLAAVPAILVGAVAAVLWMGHSRSENQRAQEFGRIESANKDLQGRLSQLEQEAATLRQKLAEQGIEVAPQSAAPARQRPDTGTSQLETVRTLTQVQGKLTAANSAIAELQNRTHELEAALARMTEENKQLNSAEAELKESLASTNRIVSVMDTEIKAKTERISQLENAARKNREDTTTAAQKLAQLSATTKELEDINRRRENTVNSLQRRYRELTDQFRGAAMRVEQNRDNPAALAPDLSRIQSTVQSAEEDLRQLIGLNTQAQRAAQKLAQK